MGHVPVSLSSCGCGGVSGSGRQWETVGDSGTGRHRETSGDDRRQPLIQVDGHEQPGRERQMGIKTTTQN